MVQQDRIRVPEKKEGWVRRSGERKQEGGGGEGPTTLSRTGRCVGFIANPPSTLPLRHHGIQVSKKYFMLDFLVCLQISIRLRDRMHTSVVVTAATYLSILGRTVS